MVTANGPDDGVCSWRATLDGAHFIELVTKPSGGRRSVLLQSDGEGTDEEQAMAHVVRAVNSYGAASSSSTPQRGWLKPWTDIVGPRYRSTFHSGRFAVPRLRRLNRQELWWTLFSRSTDRRERKEKAVDSQRSARPGGPRRLAAGPRATMKA
jgi:hypothetical protein